MDSSDSQSDPEPNFTAHSKFIDFKEVACTLLIIPASLLNIFVKKKQKTNISKVLTAYTLNLIQVRFPANLFFWGQITSFLLLLFREIATSNIFHLSHFIFLDWNAKITQKYSLILSRDRWCKYGCFVEIQSENWVGKTNAEKQFVTWKVLCA